MRITLPYTVFARKLASGRIVYYYQYRLPNGKRSPAYSTGCDTLPKARRIVQKLYNDGKLDCSNDVVFSAFTKDFFSKDSYYYKWRLVNNKKVSDNTLLAYNKILAYQLMPFFENYPISKITKDVVKQWVIWCSDKWSPKTTNLAQSLINQILNTAVDKAIISTNPINGLSFRKVEKKQRVLLTLDEIKEMVKLDWVHPIYRDMFILDVCTGMRIGEVIGLRRQDIESNKINLKHTYSRQFGLQDTTKTKMNRYIPLSDCISLPQSDNWLFTDRDDGNPVDEFRFYNSFITNCNKLGIDTNERKINVHTIRNFFISYLQSQNISEPKIRAVVGHKDSSMTGLYTYWTAEMFPEVYEAQKKLYEYITSKE